MSNQNLKSATSNTWKEGISDLTLILLEQGPNFMNYLNIMFSLTQKLINTQKDLQW